MTASVITISAAYGAGGSVIGPAVAQRLSLPFVDRAIPVAVAERLNVSLDEAAAHDERLTRGLGRLMARWGPMAAGFGAAPLLPPGMDEEEAFCAHTEAVLREAATTGAVILGRAAALVLASWPHALHVRLAGAPERRLAQAIRLRGLDEPTARRQQRENDAARQLYVHHFYRADATDARHYHLVVDATVVGTDATIELVCLAADTMGGGAGSGPTGQGEASAATPGSNGPGPGGRPGSPSGSDIGS